MVLPNKKKRKHLSQIPKRDSNVLCPHCVWLSLNENKSGATWITTRTGDDLEMDSFHFLFPCNSYGKEKLLEHDYIT